MSSPLGAPKKFRQDLPSVRPLLSDGDVSAQECADCATDANQALEHDRYPNYKPGRMKRTHGNRSVAAVNLGGSPQAGPLAEARRDV